MDPQHSLHHGPGSKGGNRIPESPTQASSIAKTSPSPLYLNSIIMRSKFSTGGALGASFPNHRHYGCTFISLFLSIFKLLYKYMLYVEHILLDTLFWYSFFFYFSLSWPSPTFPHLPPPSPCHLWWLGDFRVITGTVPQQQRHSGEQAVHSRADSVGGDTGEPARRPQGMRIQRADAAPHQPQQPGEWELFLVWVK